MCDLFEVVAMQIPHLPQVKTWALSPLRYVIEPTGRFRNEMEPMCDPFGVNIRSRHLSFCKVSNFIVVAQRFAQFRTNFSCFSFQIHGISLFFRIIPFNNVREEENR